MAVETNLDEIAKKYGNEVWVKASLLSTGDSFSFPHGLKNTITITRGFVYWEYFETSNKV